jgi:phosphate/sulfate permease
LTWPYHWSLFLSMMSIMSSFSFTPIISFIYSFFILSNLDFLADKSKYTEKNCAPTWLYLQEYFWILFSCVYIFQTQTHKSSINKTRSKHKMNEEKRENGFRYVTCDRR